MKILRKALKDGKIKLMPESLDDLWYLKGVISKGDLLSGKGVRRIRDEERVRADKGIRKRVFLEIHVENVEFHPYITRLRVTGKIVHGPEDLVSMGSYHTLEMKPGDGFTITKEKWHGWELDRLKEAEKASKTPLILIVAVEEGEAEFGVIRRYGIDYPLRVTSNIPGKGSEKDYESTMGSFYAELAGKLEEVVRREGVEVAVICGPGFTKENFLSYLKEKAPELASLCHLEGAGAGGKPGIQEVIKKGVVERIVKENRVSLETRLIEEVFKAIGRNTGMATYGYKEVEKVVDLGAVDKLLISEAKLRGNHVVDELMTKAKKKRGEVIVVSTEHEAGERLLALGGIAALLRFSVTT
jgi:protein pelota